MSSYNKSYLVDPTTLGLNAVALNAAKTSNAVDTNGYDNVCVAIDYTFGGGTNLTMYIETCEDVTVAVPVWRRVQSVSVAAGTATLSDLIYSKAAGAANKALDINFPVNYKAFRLIFAMTGVPLVTDLLTAQVRLEVGP